jgi:hypothetical protein
MSGRIIPLAEANVSGALADNNVSNAFVLGENPIGPQPLSVVFQSGWGGGPITIVGTAVDPKDPYLPDGTANLVDHTEIIQVPASLPATVETAWPYGTITSASKAMVGGSGATAQISALFPTQAPQIIGSRLTGGNVFGSLRISTNWLVLFAEAQMATVNLQPLLWMFDRWFPLPGGALVLDGTTLANRAIGRYFDCIDPTADYHVWMTIGDDGDDGGTLSAAWLYGKNGPGRPV